MSSKPDLNAKIQQLEAALKDEQLAAKALHQQRNALASQLLDAEARAAVAQAKLDEANAKQNAV